MGCCAPYEFPFAGVAFSDITMTDDMKQNLGSYPKVEILAYDPDTDTFYSTNGIPGMEIKFDGSVIHVDHGGIGSGVIKIT